MLHVHMQRVLNDLKRGRLFCGRMIRLHAQPLPHLSRQQAVSLSQSSFVSPVELTDGRGGGGREIIGQQLSLALFKLFKTLWLHMRITDKLLHDIPVQKY
jgi:hypothetical protein